LYKEFEKVSSQEKIHATVAASLVPFHPQLSRVPTHDDRERLLNIPIRRISKFDIDKNQEEVAELNKQLSRVERDLKNMKKFTIAYLQDLIKKYGKAYKRRTEI